MTSPLRIGILSTANIARAYCKAIAGQTAFRVVAVASRDRTKAAAFARDEKIDTVHGSYEALLADPNVDAIYNPLPNSLHAAWTIKAVEHGKHVLCEKPLALSVADARAMYAAASRHNVHLVEGYPYLSQPHVQKLRALLAERAIGDLKLINAMFGAFQFDLANIRFNAALGGGSLWDMGSYPMSLVRVVAGRKPIAVQALAAPTPTGVDYTTSINMAFDGGLIASVTSSMAGAYHRYALISGDQGTIETTYLNHPPIGGPAELVVRRGRMVTDPVERIAVQDGNGFLAETVSFADMVRNGPSRWNGATPQESIDIAEMLAAVAESVRTGKRVDLSP
jgi:D-xylose 1-dehydrogenase (NADP+, D-xylono-1,5-lactone-forming)